MSLIDVKKKLLMAQKGGLDVSDVFNISLWTGTGAARTITTGIDSGEGSLVWIKGRSASTDNLLVDTIRGAGNYLVSNSTAASVSNAQSVSAFGPSGYSLGNLSSVNGSSQTYVGWQFRRAPKFFDIVQYTGNGVSGRAIAHDLGVKPGIVIIKRFDAASDWQVYHQSQGATKFGVLNSTSVFATSSTQWNNTEPTASAFMVGDGATVNASGGTYIAYLIAHDPDPEGFIQCGSYVGNGSSTGPIINLGWRPQYLMIKRATTASGQWLLRDSLRGGDSVIYASSDAVETSMNLEFLPDGFQPKTAHGAQNGSGSTYVYMAIREAA